MRWLSNKCSSFTFSCVLASFSHCWQANGSRCQYFKRNFIREKVHFSFELGRQSFLQFCGHSGATYRNINVTPHFWRQSSQILPTAVFCLGCIFFLQILHYLPTCKYGYISHEMTRVLSSLEKLNIVATLVSCSYMAVVG